MKKAIVLSFLCWWGLSVLAAQTAAEMETLLETPAVTYAQAARFVLEASDAAKIADPAEAFLFAAERNWLSKKTAPENEARLDEVSLLLMRSFNLKGGLFYSMAHNPHYAYREMVYQAAIQGKVDPHMSVSGFQLIFMTNRILSFLEQ